MGVQAHCFLKVAAQVDRVMKLMFGTLPFIRKAIVYKSLYVMLQLYIVETTAMVNGQSFSHQLRESNTRLKVRGERFKGDLKDYFFSHGGWWLCGRDGYNNNI